MKARACLRRIESLDNVNVVNIINALYAGLSTAPMMAYIVNMAIRLVVIRQKQSPMDQSTCTVIQARYSTSG